MWTIIEAIKVALQAVAIVVMVVGLYFAIRQLRLLRLTYSDLHDWNRRKAAQDAIEKMQSIDADNPLLQDKFNILGKNDPLPLELVLKECEASGAVRAALHRRLNYFESLAVGVNQSVFDEHVVKAAFKQVFQRTLTQFRPYISHRQHGVTTGAWSEFHNLTEKWEREAISQQRRAPTGTDA